MLLVVKIVVACSWSNLLIESDASVVVSALRTRKESVDWQALASFLEVTNLLSSFLGVKFVNIRPVTEC